MYIHDSTPEIDTSEIIVDFQCCVPMDFRCHFAIRCHLSVVYAPKGLLLVQWISAGVVPRISVVFSNGISLL